jgi:holo-[acyl-carrier protein] synthase
MNIKGIGTDIVEIKKLRLAYTRRGQTLLNKIFTDKEKKYCLKYKDPLPHFAARFAVKEAIVKAFGTGFGKDISFKDIEMLNNSNGEPKINLSKKLQKKFNNPNILISISHSESYAIAFCIIQ